MSPTIPLLLLVLLSTSTKTGQQQFHVKDENTEADLLCADSNVAMNFSNLNLGSVNNNFITSPVVTCLDLKQNGITGVSNQTFDGVPNLKYLQISSNDFTLTDLFANRFENLEVLLLDDSYTRYHYDPSIIIEHIFPKLRKLFMRTNDIKDISVFNSERLPSLTHLFLSENHLFNDDFAWLPESLQYLDLTSNILETLTLKNLKNLKRILIDKSYEKRLHSLYFENLTNLNYLSASSNTINEISTQTFLNTSSLLYLDLSDNSIQYIEGGSFDSMNKLQFLNLSSNAIEVIQGGLFENLSNLKVLILEKNSITMFPMIGNPTVLESLSLNCNRIKTIIGGTFAKMPLLENLFLHDNEITNIDQEAFAGLEKLKVLTLSNNELSVLPQHWMKPLTNLKELDLAGNQFLSFGNLALSKSLTLKNIYLSNQMLFIETASLIDLPVNATINLDARFNFTEQCNVQLYE